MPQSSSRTAAAIAAIAVLAAAAGVAASDACVTATPSLAFSAPPTCARKAHRSHVSFVGEESNGGDRHANLGDGDNFIVRYDAYKPASRHRRELWHALRAAGVRTDDAAFRQESFTAGNGTEGEGEAEVVWIDRRNVAARLHPTDFALVRVRAPTTHAREAALDALEAVHGVRDVYADSPLSSPLRELQARPDTDASRRLDARRGRSDSKEPERIDFPNGGFRDVKHPRYSELLDAKSVWRDGHRGGGIRVGIFDTGLVMNTPWIENVGGRTDWTDDGRGGDDGHFHGTYSAGCVASTHPDCSGPAPDAEIFALKVFTDKGESFTNW